MIGEVDGVQYTDDKRAEIENLLQSAFWSEYSSCYIYSDKEARSLINIPSVDSFCVKAHEGRIEGIPSDIEVDRNILCAVSGLSFDSNLGRISIDFIMPIVCSYYVVSRIRLIEG